MEGDSRRCGWSWVTAAASTRPAFGRFGGSRRSSGQVFFALVRDEPTVIEGLPSGREHEDLYQLAELLIALGRAHLALAHAAPWSSRA